MVLQLLGIQKGGENCNVAERMYLDKYPERRQPAKRTYMSYLIVIICLMLMENLSAETPEEKEALKEEIRNLPRVNFSMATATDPLKIMYKLYTINNPDSYVILTEKTVQSQNIDKHIKTNLFIHGYSADDNSPWYKAAKKNYFTKGPHNIIYINWSAYGNLSYEVSAANVKPVGEFIAKLLKKSQVLPKNIHVLGHSMGGQVAAYVGKSYKKICGKNIGRITGLDPSSRKFSSSDVENEERLNKFDADFVDVVHTDMQIYGFTKPCGRVDYYPNGGANQPGCAEQTKEPTEKCNHHRSYLYFVESITTQVDALEINFEEDKHYNITITPKKYLKKVIFGEDVDLEARGSYYFETNSTKPFLIGNT